MDIQLIADEIFEMAKQVERLGMECYLQLANSTSDPVLRKVFEDLATMEGEHFQIFDAIRARALSHPLDKKQETSAVLWRSIACEMVANLGIGLATRFDGKCSRQAVLQEALGFEKDTIVFLLAMKDLVRNSTDKKKIDLLIREELGHVLLLNSQMTRPAAPMGLTQPEPQPAANRLVGKTD